MAKEVHPHITGRSEMDRMFGDLALRRRQWMLGAVIAGCTSIILAVGMVTLVLTDRNIPWIIEVDSFGQVRFAGEIAMQEAPERVRRAMLYQVIRNIRQVPGDARILNAQHEAALAHMSRDAATQFLTDITANQDRLAQMIRRKQRRFVLEINSVLPFPRQPNLYRVTWIEERTGDAGTETAAYEGHFLVSQAPPPPELVMLNPLGVFITEYSITPITESES